MVGRRKSHLGLGMSRLYVYEGKRRCTYYTITPANERVNLGHELKEAKRRLLEMDGEPVKPGSVADLLDDLMVKRRKMAQDGRISVLTVKTNELEIEQLKKAFGKMLPEDVRPAHVWAYLHKFRGAESPVRANREIALFASMFNMALGAGVVDRNPCVGVERNHETPRDRLVDDVELHGFVHFCWRRSEAGKNIALAAMLSYLTGKAQAQILRLSKAQISAEGIQFDKRKRGAATLVEWSPRLRRYVSLALAMPSDISPMFVIHTRSGTPYTRNGFSALWHRLMNEWVSAGHKRFTFHDLRAKTVTDVSEQGRKASELTGHRTESIVAKVYDRRRVRRAAPAR